MTVLDKHPSVLNYHARQTVELCAEVLRETGAFDTYSFPGMHDLRSQVTTISRNLAADSLDRLTWQHFAEAHEMHSAARQLQEKCVRELDSLLRIPFNLEIETPAAVLDRHMQELNARSAQGGAGRLDLTWIHKEGHSNNDCIQIEHRFSPEPDGPVNIQIYELYRWRTHDPHNPEIRRVIWDHCRPERKEYSHEHDFRAIRDDLGNFPIAKVRTVVGCVLEAIQRSPRVARIL